MNLHYNPHRVRQSRGCDCPPRKGFTGLPVPNFLYGCPGRLVAFWTRENLQVSSCKFLSLSEGVSVCVHGCGCIIPHTTDSTLIYTLCSIVPRLSVATRLHTMCTVHSLLGPHVYEYVIAIVRNPYSIPCSSPESTALTSLSLASALNSGQMKNWANLGTYVDRQTVITPFQ